MEPRLSGQRAGSHWLWPGGSMPFEANARAGGRVTLPTLPTQGRQPCFHFLELLILPTGWRERARTWLPAESLLIMVPCTCSSVPHRGGCPDAYPCHAGLHHGSCDPGALTPGPPIAGPMDILALCREFHMRSSVALSSILPWTFPHSPVEEGNLCPLLSD